MMTCISQPADVGTLIDAATVARLLNLTPMTVHRWRVIGRLPPAVFAGPQATLWRREEIEAFIAAGHPVDVATWLASRRAGA